MVYSTRYDKSADRQISDRTDRPSPDLFVPGRDLRYRSGIQQYRGMVVVDPRGRPASQGSAVLSSARREFGIGIRRLRVRAKSVAGRFGRADPAFASRRDFRQGQVGQLSPAQSLAELKSASSQTCSPDVAQRNPGPPRIALRSMRATRLLHPTKKALRSSAFSFDCEVLLTSLADWPRACRPAGWPRASCGRPRRVSATLPAAFSG